MKITPSEAGVLAHIALLVANNCDADKTLAKLIDSLKRTKVCKLAEEIRNPQTTNKMAKDYIAWAKKQVTCESSEACRATQTQPCAAG